MSAMRRKRRQLSMSPPRMEGGRVCSRGEGSTFRPSWASGRAGSCAGARRPACRRCVGTGSRSTAGLGPPWGLGSWLCRRVACCHSSNKSWPFNWATQEDAGWRKLALLRLQRPIPCSGLCAKVSQNASLDVLLGVIFKKWLQGRFRSLKDFWPPLFSILFTVTSGTHKNINKIFPSTMRVLDMCVHHVSMPIYKLWVDWQGCGGTWETQLQKPRQFPLTLIQNVMRNYKGRYILSW